MLKSIGTGVLAYLCAIVLWFIYSFVAGMITQKAIGTASVYALPCIVFGVLFVLTGFLLLRL